ncbi:unnamed protein product [Sympodiomycopsis kandeliae]
MVAAIGTALPMDHTNITIPTAAEGGSAVDCERRGRAPGQKRITGYASSSRQHSRNRSKPPTRRYGRVTIEHSSARRSAIAGSSSDESEESSGSEFELDSDPEQDIGSSRRRSPTRTTKLGFNVAHDLDTFAFDSDEEGEQLRSIQQQNDWLRSKGKDAKDFRFVLGSSRTDGIVARQLLTEIGLDGQSRLPLLGSDASDSQYTSSLTHDAVSPRSNKRGQTAISPATSPQLSSRARFSTSPVMDAQLLRSQSPEWGRGLSPLQFARKPSLTSGNQGGIKARNATLLTQPTSQPTSSSLRRLSSNPDRPFVNARDLRTRIGSKSSSGSQVTERLSGLSTFDRRVPSSRNSSISNIDSLPWVRNLRTDGQHASTSSNGEDDESDSSLISFPQEGNAKKDRRLSGTSTRVCKATPTTFCDRKYCDRHGPQAQVLSLASGSLRQSLGHAKYRTRSQSETHIDVTL